MPLNRAGEGVLVGNVAQGHVFDARKNSFKGQFLCTDPSCRRTLNESVNCGGKLSWRRFDSLDNCFVVRNRDQEASKPAHLDRQSLVDIGLAARGERLGIRAGRAKLLQRGTDQSAEPCVLQVLRRACDKGLQGGYDTVERSRQLVFGRCDIPACRRASSLEVSVDGWRRQFCQLIPCPAKACGPLCAPLPVVVCTQTTGC